MSQVQSLHRGAVVSVEQVTQGNSHTLVGLAGLARCKQTNASCTSLKTTVRLFHCWPAASPLERPETSGCWCLQDARLTDAAMINSTHKLSVMYFLCKREPSWHVKHWVATALTLTMCSESSPFSLVDSSIRQGTGVRCCVISTTGAPLRQLATGTLLGMSCKVHTENDAAEM